MMCSFWKTHLSGSDDGELPPGVSARVQARGSRHVDCCTVAWAIGCDTRPAGAPSLSLLLTSFSRLLLPAPLLLDAMAGPNEAAKPAASSKAFVGPTRRIWG